MSCLKSTTYWVSLFHILHVKYGIKQPNSLSFFFIILASDLTSEVNKIHFFNNAAAGPASGPCRSSLCRCRSSLSRCRLQSVSLPVQPEPLPVQPEPLLVQPKPLPVPARAATGTAWAAADLAWAAAGSSPSCYRSSLSRCRRYLNCDWEDLRTWEWS